MYRTNIGNSRYSRCWLPSAYRKIRWHSPMAVANVYMFNASASWNVPGKCLTNCITLIFLRDSEIRSHGRHFLSLLFVNKPHMHAGGLFFVSSVSLRKRPRLLSNINAFVWLFLCWSTRRKLVTNKLKKKKATVLSYFFRHSFHMLKTCLVHRHAGCVP